MNFAQLQPEYHTALTEMKLLERHNLAVQHAVGRERSKQHLEPVPPVAALRQHAAVHRVRDRAEAVELEFEGPFRPVEGFAPGGRDDRGDGHTVLIPSRNRRVNRLGDRRSPPRSSFAGEWYA